MQSVVYLYVANSLLFQKQQANFNDFAGTLRYNRYNWRPSVQHDGMSGM